MKKLLLVVLALGLTTRLFAQGYKTQNIIIVTIDGLRWQEVYRGADSALINSAYTDDKPTTKKQYWSEDEGERRQMLFPFLWSVIDRSGQLYGNRDAGNHDEVKKFLKAEILFPVVGGRTRSAMSKMAVAVLWCVPS